MSVREETIGDCRIVAIYALCEGPDNRPRYVGKTVRYLHERHKRHISDALKRPRLPVHRWLRKQHDTGKQLIIKLLEYVQPERDWRERETFWIKHFRDSGCDLLNLTDGGEGTHGIVFSPERNEKVAAKLRRGSHFDCEQCGERFWRKPRDIKRGNNRFCSRRCYQAWQIGRTKPVAAAIHVAGGAAAAEARRARTHCRAGHPLSGENLNLHPRGVRDCRACSLAAKHRYRANGGRG